MMIKIKVYKIKKEKNTHREININVLNPNEN